MPMMAQLRFAYPKNTLIADKAISVVFRSERKGNIRWSTSKFEYRAE